jgi:hypothetical protein
MQNRIKRINNKYYLGAFISPAIVFIIFAIVDSILSVSGVQREMMGNKLAGFFSPIAEIYTIFLGVSLILFHYRMWATIYEKDMKVGKAKVDPVAAVVLFLVPFVGEFWTFKFYSFFVSRFNEDVSEYAKVTGNPDGLRSLPVDISAFKVLPVLRMTALIFTLLSMMFSGALYIVGFFYVIMYLVFLIIVWQTCDAVNRLADAIEMNERKI